MGGGPQHPQLLRRGSDRVAERWENLLAALGSESQPGGLGQTGGPEQGNLDPGTACFTGLEIRVSFSDGLKALIVFKVGWT